MKRLFFTCLLAVLGLFANAQLNMTLLDQINYTQNCSSLWGYIDPEDGTEYAAVGTVTGLSVVSLEDPSNATEILFIPDVTSTWREVKSYGHYIYAVTEGGGGMLVVDMTNAPDDITWTHWMPDIPGLGTLNRVHTITVDEFGILYLNGSNLNSGGVLFVDVSADDGNPVYVGKAPAIYCHDSYARDNILYTSDIYAGVFSVYDVSDKSDVKLLATQTTPYLFTHNTWLNDAGTVIYTTDERPNAPVAAYDISDWENIIELDQFRPVATLGMGVVPHNVHVWNDWVVTAYYTDGTIIIDGSRPENLIEVGYFDSFVSQTAGFFGVWGVYPYFPSGIVIASDMQNGLLVYDVNYVRACWLEGKVTSAETGLPIAGASIHIESTQANMGFTNLNGEYKTGQAIPGIFDVEFSAVGYITKIVQATLENGVLTILDVELEPFSNISINGMVVRAEDGSPIPGAQVVIQNDQTSFNAATDDNGMFTFPAVFFGNYTIYAGAWGYLHTAIENFSVDLNTPSPVVLTMNRGYQDDFFADLGWTETHTATSGFWVRDVPIGTELNGQWANPPADVPDDLGNKCYVTGNGGGAAGNDDVDDGVVTLYSPLMDLRNFNEPVLKYRTWFFNAGGAGQPNDALQVRITNGTDVVVLETITQSLSVWRPESVFNLTGLIEMTETMQVIFETSDLPGTGHIVEAAVDAFLLFDQSPYPFFTTSDTEGCAPFTVSFTELSDSTAVWNWTFEGGSPATSNEQNPTVTYDTPGSYGVTLSVITSEGNPYSVTRPGLITVKAGPAADFNYSVGGQVVNFTNLSSGGGTFTWTFGDGASSTETNPVHTYQATGIFPVTLTTINECGTSETSQTVQILHIQPTASFSADTVIGCTPLTVQFTDISTGGPDTWSWVFPGGEPFSSNEQNPLVTYNEPGVFTVQLVASNPAGQSSSIQPQFISVGSAPAAAFSYTTDGGTVSFVNASTGGFNYVWDFGDGNTSNETNPTHTYLATGEYEVVLSVTNDCGTGTFTQTLNIIITSVDETGELGLVLAAMPNPFGDELLVKYELKESLSDVDLRVSNVLGQILHTRPIGNANGTIRLGSDVFPGSGIYFIQLSVDGKMSRTLRVVKL